MSTHSARIGRSIQSSLDPARDALSGPEPSEESKGTRPMRVRFEQQELKTTTIYVTHDQAEVMTLGTRVAVMQKGCIVQIGAPMELYRNPRHRFVATFIGSPSMSLLDGGRGGTPVQIGCRPEDVLTSLVPREGSDEARTLVCN